MPETIRYAVVRWNARIHEARPTLIEDTTALEHGAAVHTVRESSGLVTLTYEWDVEGVRRYFARTFNLPDSAVAVVEVFHAV